MSDELKQNLESFVASALRSRVEEGARAVVDLRAQLLASLERLESEIRTAGEKTLSIPDDLLPQPVPAPPVTEEAAVLTHLYGAQQEMLAASDQVGLLTQLLLACTVSCPRVAFFIARKDGMLGWAARGFEGARDADIRSLSIGFDDETILSEAYRSAAPVIAGSGEYSQDGAFLAKLGGNLPVQSMAVPVFLRDKIAAVLYGDSGQDERITDPELPQILALHAGLCLETLATRQKFPRPKPSERSVSAPREAEVPQPATQAPPEAASLSGVIQKPSGLTPPSGSPAFTSAASPEPAPAPAPAAPAPAPTPTPPEAEEVTVEPEAPAAIPVEDEKVHEEAKRFARLLVSEMVLYNEKQVEEGRRNKDLYQRLKDDIDRSHHMYEQRISAEVRASSNYFLEEMIRTLANGDESALKVPWA